MGAPTSTAAEFWIERVQRDPLVLLLDLDGTLIPFADTPEAALFDRQTIRLLDALSAAQIRVVIVTGRSLALAERVRPGAPRAWWVAEHGAWKRTGDEWQGPEQPVDFGDLAAQIHALAIPGIRIETKSMGIAVHWRLVPALLREVATEAIQGLCSRWLEAHPDLARLDGVQLIELRHRSITKARAVEWVRAELPDAYMIAIGDDLTDEDMFGALREDELAIAVGTERDRTTRAHTWLSGPSAVREFLWWMLEVRLRREEPRPPPELVAPIVRARRSAPRLARSGLVVVSNRTPTAPAEGRQRQVGGLVSALEPALRAIDGVWVGWSGAVSEQSTPVQLQSSKGAARGTFELTASLRDRFYSGFCTSTLWPLLHSISNQVRYSDDHWSAYVEANALYARHVASVASPVGTVWVHDYHLLLAADELRKTGHHGPIGLFLHVPFPPRDIFETLPWCDHILDAMRSFDLIGFHTDQWAENFRSCAAARDQRAGVRARWPLTTVLPIGVDPNEFLVDDTDPDAEVEELKVRLGGRKLILGVDRLDYSKGIPERLAAFERMLELHPEWRGAVTLVQVSVPSRMDVPGYIDLRSRVENMVGRINGQYGEAGWVPVRYLYRSYEQQTLAHLYRAAAVALVTPLRDGLNLVAKEFVAAQDSDDPGVLVLSRFAGAAVELEDAILTNPYHTDGLAADLDRALRMSLAERKRRQASLAAIISVQPPARWAAAFLESLRAQATAAPPYPRAAAPRR